MDKIVDTNDACRCIERYDLSGESGVGVEVLEDGGMEDWVRG